MAKPKLWTKNFLSVSLASFFIFLVFYMLMVTLPIYISDELNGNGNAIGLNTAIFVLSAIIFRPFAGQWLESAGQKKILLVGASVFLAASLLYIGTKSVLLLLILRFFHGIGFGIATTATGGIIANVIPDERRGEGMGYYSTFMNLAMVIGPFLGLSVTHGGNYYLLFILSILFAVLALVCCITLTLPEEKMGRRATAGFRFNDLFEKSAMPIAITGFALSIVYSAVLSFISIYARELNYQEAASFFFVVYAVCLLLSRPFTGKWFDQYGANVVVYPSIFLFGLGILLLSQASSSLMFLVAGGIIGVGFGTLMSSFQSIAIQSAAPNRRGLAMATYFVLFDLGVAAGSFLLGILAAYIGYGTVYLVSSLIVFLSIGLYYLLQGRKMRNNVLHAKGK
ncbi:MFS transporter [Peribacillus glennii]|uniref:MFS transporter n=1 Tax=Peribacillus glennii TaxID=2303991 RepID=A0A372L623_9BACI|nr:MFS transporter [Peribacillus glennii]RFU60422.1 MFS transporter [Peribacillus glennii]